MNSRYYRRLRVAKQLEMDDDQFECMLHPLEDPETEGGEVGVEAVVFVPDDEEWFWVWS